MNIYYLILLYGVGFGVTQENRSCRDENGLPLNIPPFTKAETCKEGIYYTCENGEVIQNICHLVDEVYNFATRRCELYTEEACSSVSSDICPTNLVAGPHPNGYECEDDCSRADMCWDHDAQKCLCVEFTTCPKYRLPESTCPVKTSDARCNPSASVEVYPDVSHCRNFFLCVFGNRYHFACQPGLVFSQDSPSYCDDASRVPPPCGILGK